jgi:hypothetical protein
MSEKKKEIYVKDLVIKADNVFFEPPKPRRFDPFFGPRRRDVEDSEVKVEAAEDVENKEESSESAEKHRRPFSWI